MGQAHPARLENDAFRDERNGFQILCPPPKLSNSIKRTINKIDASVF